MNTLSLQNKKNIKHKKLQFTSIGYKKYLKGLVKIKYHRMFRNDDLLSSLAVKTWEVAPGNTSIVTKAFFLDGQLDRVTNNAVTDDPNLLMIGGNKITHAPTKAYLLKNTWMLNGNVYKGVNQLLYHPSYQITSKKRYFPPIKIDTEINNAAIYHTYDGFKAFGVWLSDDCTLYKLAESEGTPVTSNIFASPHMLEYESLLGMNPVRSNAAYLKSAVFFDDNWDNNYSKHERFASNRNKLLSKFKGSKHPGIFIIRGNSGKKRIMLNEIEIAEQLHKKYGFKVMDVNKNSVSEILSASVGAQIVIGVEGSHLMHGLMVLEPGTSVLTLQPPNRFCGVLKMTTDMENINYGFVVGTQKKEGFYVNLEEVERTIDLLPIRI